MLAGVLISARAAVGVCVVSIAGGQAIVQLGPDGQTFAGCRGRGESDACELEAAWLGKRVVAPAAAPVAPPVIDEAPEKDGEAEQSPGSGDDAEGGAAAPPPVEPGLDAGTAAP